MSSYQSSLFSSIFSLFLVLLLSYPINSQVTIYQEGENNFIYSGPGASPIVWPRGAASNSRTVWQRNTNGILTWNISIPAAGNYTLKVGYSNDDTGVLDSLSVLVNGQRVAAFESTNTWSEGLEQGAGWDIFTVSPTLSLGNLDATEIELALELTEHDGFGIEIDYLELHCQSCTLSCNTPPILTTPNNGSATATINPTLNWQAISGAESYRIQIDDDASFSTPLTDISNITQTSFQTSGLIEGNTYYWRVRAQCGGEAGPWSSTWSFITEVVSTTIVFELGDAMGAPGEEVGVAVTLDVSDQQICSFDLELSFDADQLALTAVTAGPAIIDTDWFLDFNSGNNLVSGFSQGSPVGIEGALVILHFQISESALDDCTTISLENALAGNCQGFELTSQFADTGEVCVDSGHSLEGSIFYFSAINDAPGDPVENITVQLIDLNSGSLFASVFTNADGQYHFSDIPLGMDLAIRPLSPDDVNWVGQAVNATDAFRIFQSSIQSNPLTSYFQHIIADLNNTCSINSPDAFLAFQLGIGQISDLSLFGLEDWAFVPLDFDLNETNWCDPPAEIQIFNSSNDQTDLDFISGIYGDANSTGVSNLTSNPSGGLIETPTHEESLLVNGDSVCFSIPMPEASPGDTLNIPVLVDIPEQFEIGSIQFELTFDTSQINILGYTLGEIFPELEGSWFSGQAQPTANQVIFGAFATDTFPLSGSGVLAEFQIVIGEDLNQNEIIPLLLTNGSAGNLNSEDLPSCLNSSEILVAVDEYAELAASSFTVHQNHPNPCQNQTRITYELPAAGWISCVVYDGSGRLVYASPQEWCLAGEQSTMLNCSALKNGVYFYKMVYSDGNAHPTHSRMKKLVVFR